MKLHTLTNFIAKVLVLALGTSQAALGSQVVLDFSVPNANVVVSTPRDNHKPTTVPAPTKEVVSSIAAESLFASAKSPGSVAVGAAEGNLTLTGKTTSLYLGHTDPGNHVTNRGFCSWNRAANLTVAEADRRCLAALQRQGAATVKNLLDLGIDPKTNIEAVVNGTDLSNQSNRAGADFAQKYKEALDKGLGDRSALLYARVEAFRNESGQLDASGLFGICKREAYYQSRLTGLKPYSESWRWQCIALDQGRRVEVVSNALKQNLGDLPLTSAAKGQSVVLATRSSSPPAQPVSEPVGLSFDSVVQPQAIAELSVSFSPIQTDSNAIAPPVALVQNVVYEQSVAAQERSLPPEKVQPPAVGLSLALTLEPIPASKIPTAAASPKTQSASNSAATPNSRSGNGKTVKFPTKSYLSSSPKRGETIDRYLVSSAFGSRKRPCAGCSNKHEGVDVATPIGTPLYAIALRGATVKVECFTSQVGGLTAIVKSESVPDRSFAAVHLSSCFPGTHQAGEIFARTGNSGAATTGPHLHWGEKFVLEYVPPQRGYVEWAIAGKVPQEFN